MIFRKIFFKMFRFAESIQIGKYTVSFQMSRIRYLNMCRIRVHTHNLFFDITFRKQPIRLHQHLIINGIEFTDNLPCLLNHWKLIFSRWYNRCLKSSNICCLTDRICKKSDRNTGLKIAHFNF